jgi:hypothetical protein
MNNVSLLFRIDIGFDPERGYACTVLDIQGEKQKGIRGNSIEQLVSRMRHVLLEEMHKRKSFPLEAEKSRIITPNGFG